ncbi:hypothetical protein M8C21_017582 [Ambrosia artemisiifolia]|uniref:Uncharacterized protein n=1 Tax=Ambrosia artemisiifolia TaxID=4212 RepID=A0AAD5GM06_AMBAR|nr:hypothetical protein M8C21_017582 [Ambrosia artemisiifolia]
MDGIFLSQYDEYFSKTEFNNIADVNASKVKTVVVVATIELIPVEIPWFYISYTKCHRKMVKLDDEGGDEGLYPDDFKELIGKKFAFKIEISRFNVDKKIWFLKILKLTDNSDIISELEKKANNYEPGYSESLSNMVSESPYEAAVNLKDVTSKTLSNTSSGMPSPDTVNLQANVEVGDENVTPVSKADNANLKRQIAAEVIFKRKLNGRLLKRQLGEDFEEEPASFSATKGVSDGKKALLIPKIEK